MEYLKTIAQHSGCPARSVGLTCGRFKTHLNRRLPAWTPHGWRR